MCDRDRTENCARREIFKWLQLLCLSVVQFVFINITKTQHGCIRWEPSHLTFDPYKDRYTVRVGAKLKTENHANLLMRSRTCRNSSNLKPARLVLRKNVFTFCCTSCQILTRPYSSFWRMYRRVKVASTLLEPESCKENGNINFYFNILLVQ